MRFWLGAAVVAMILACGGGEVLEQVEEEVVEEEPAPRAKAKRGKRTPARSGEGGGGGSAESPKADPAPAPAQRPSDITDLGGGTYGVKRARVRKWEDKPGRFAKVKKKNAGWALKGVPDRDARWVGFENGDIIQKVNGRSVKSESEAAAAYATMRSDKKFKVQFKRDGASRTVTLKVVD